MFNFASAVSLMMCLIIIALSVAQKDLTFSQIVGSKLPRKYSFGFDGHAFVFEIQDVPSESEIAAAISGRGFPWGRLGRTDVFVGRDPSIRNSLGPIYTERGNLCIGINSLDGSYMHPRPLTGTFTFVAISTLIPILLFGILPAIYSYRLLLHLGRNRTGLCRMCSYNLTGNTSGVCPECGTPAARKLEIIA